MVPEFRGGKKVVRELTQEGIEDVLPLIAWRNNCTVPKKQGKLDILEYGLLDKVDSLVNKSSEELKIAYESTYQWDRLDPTINRLANTLNLSDKDLDRLFQLAETK